MAKSPSTVSTAPTEEEDRDVCELVNIVGVTAASYDNEEDSEEENSFVDEA